MDQRTNNAVTEEIEYHNNIGESIVHIPNMGFSITSYFLT